MDITQWSGSLPSHIHSKQPALTFIENTLPYLYDSPCSFCLICLKEKMCAWGNWLLQCKILITSNLICYLLNHLEAYSVKEVMLIFIK